jgi:hypothetical protein
MHCFQCDNKKATFCVAGRTSLFFCTQTCLDKYETYRTLIPDTLLSPASSLFVPLGVKEGQKGGGRKTPPEDDDFVFDDEDDEEDDDDESESEEEDEEYEEEEEEEIPRSSERKKKPGPMAAAGPYRPKKATPPSQRTLPVVPAPRQRPRLVVTMGTDVDKIRQKSRLLAEAEARMVELEYELRQINDRDQLTDAVATRFRPLIDDIARLRSERDDIYRKASRDAKKIIAQTVEMSVAEEEATEMAVDGELSAKARRLGLTQASLDSERFLVDRLLYEIQIDQTHAEVRTLEKVDHPSDDQIDALHRLYEQLRALLMHELDKKGLVQSRYGDLSKLLRRGKYAHHANKVAQSQNITVYRAFILHGDAKKALMEQQLRHVRKLRSRYTKMLAQIPRNIGLNELETTANTAIATYKALVRRQSTKTEAQENALLEELEAIATQANEQRLASEALDSVRSRDRMNDIHDTALLIVRIQGKTGVAPRSDTLAEQEAIIETCEDRLRVINSVQRDTFIDPVRPFVHYRDDYVDVATGEDGDVAYMNHRTRIETNWRLLNNIPDDDDDQSSQQQQLTPEQGALKARAKELSRRDYTNKVKRQQRVELVQRAIERYPLPDREQMIEDEDSGETRRMTDREYTEALDSVVRDRLRYTTSHQQQAPDFTVEELVGAVQAIRITERVAEKDTDVGSLAPDRLFDMAAHDMDLREYQARFAHTPSFQDFALIDAAVEAGVDARHTYLGETPDFVTEPVADFYATDFLYTFKSVLLFYVRLCVTDPTQGLYRARLLSYLSFYTHRKSSLYYRRYATAEGKVLSSETFEAREVIGSKAGRIWQNLEAYRRVANFTRIYTILDIINNEL